MVFGCSACDYATKYATNFSWCTFSITDGFSASNLARQSAETRGGIRNPAQPVNPVRNRGDRDHSGDQSSDLRESLQIEGSTNGVRKCLGANRFFEQDPKTSLPRKPCLTSSDNVVELIERSCGLTDRETRLMRDQAIATGRGEVFLNLNGAHG